MIRSLVIGESHTVCIQQAAQDEPWRAQGIDIHRLQSGRRSIDADALSLDQAIAAIAGLPAQTAIVLSMLGTYHNILGLLRCEPDFDFQIGRLSKADQFGELLHQIPARAMASAFDAHFEKAHAVIKLRRVATGRVYLLGTPPPKQSNSFMMDKLMGMVKKDYRGRNIAEAGLNRPELRLKFWQIESERLALWSGKNEITFLPPPEAAFDSSGFLAERYYGDDATHANAAFGSLMLDQINSVVATRAELSNHG